MNNLFGFGSTLGDLAKDFNGFVREVVDELQTVTTQEAENTNDNVANDSEFDEEQAIEEELRHQLLQLSDDEDGPGPSTIRDIDIDKAIDELKANEPNEPNENDQPQQQQQQTDKQQQEQEQEQEQKEETKSLKEYNNLQEKYVQLKQHYRKSILLVEKYQIYNKSLKETLNEQMIMREKQQSEINESQLVNDQLNQKTINLQNEIDTMHANQKESRAEKLSIFEEDSSKATSPDSEMVIKSVTMGRVIENDNEESLSKIEADKLRKTLQKASTNMKELKKRYKKVKDDLCNKIEEFDQLKSQYVTYKMSSSKQLQELKNKLRNSMNNGLNKELQMILNSKFVEYGICKVDMINPLHLEMISILNGCIETMGWVCNNSGIGKYGMNNNIDDNKSDSVVIINDANKDMNDIMYIDMIGLEGIKMNVISLREIVCEFIGGIQQWLKVLNDAIDRKHDGNGDGDNENGRTKSSTEEFQSID